MGRTLSLLFTVDIVTGLMAAFRSPFSQALALGYLALAYGIGLVLLALARRRGRRAPSPQPVAA